MLNKIIIKNNNPTRIRLINNKIQINNLKEIQVSFPHQ